MRTAGMVQNQVWVWLPYNHVEKRQRRKNERIQRMEYPYQRMQGGNPMTLVECPKCKVGFTGKVGDPCFRCGTPVVAYFSYAEQEDDEEWPAKTLNNYTMNSTSQRSSEIQWETRSGNSKAVCFFGPILLERWHICQQDQCSTAWDISLRSTHLQSDCSTSGYPAQSVQSNAQ